MRMPRSRGLAHTASYQPTRAQRPSAPHLGAAARDVEVCAGGVERDGGACNQSQGRERGVFEAGAPATAGRCPAPAPAPCTPPHTLPTKVGPAKQGCSTWRQHRSRMGAAAAVQWAPQNRPPPGGGSAPCHRCPTRATSPQLMHFAAYIPSSSSCALPPSLPPSLPRHPPASGSAPSTIEARLALRGTHAKPAAVSHVKLLRAGRGGHGERGGGGGGGGQRLVQGRTQPRRERRNLVQCHTQAQRVGPTSHSLPHGVTPAHPDQPVQSTATGRQEVCRPGACRHGQLSTPPSPTPALVGAAARSRAPRHTPLLLQSAAAQIPCRPTSPGQAREDGDARGKVWGGARAGLRDGARAGLRDGAWAGDGHGCGQGSGRQGSRRSVGSVRRRRCSSSVAAAAAVAAAAIQLGPSACAARPPPSRVLPLQSCSNHCLQGWGWGAWGA